MKLGYERDAVSITLTATSSPRAPAEMDLVSSLEFGDLPRFRSASSKSSVPRRQPFEEVLHRDLEGERKLI